MGKAEEVVFPFVKISQEGDKVVKRWKLIPGKNFLVLLVVGVLLLVSCGPKAAPTPAAPTPAAPTPAAPTPAVPTPAAPVAPAPKVGILELTVSPPPLETPKYGGTINYNIWGPSGMVHSGLDPGVANTGGWGTNLVFEQYWTLDRTRGVTGTGEFDYRTGYFPYPAFGPNLVESWEVPKPGVWNMNLRKGVHFGLDPTSEASRLVNGREWDVEDAIMNFKHRVQPGSWTSYNQPRTLANTSVEQTGPWSVTFNMPVDPFAGWCWVVYGCACGGHNQFPREVIQKYGNMLNWKNAVGTGPFFLTDHVEGSVTTLTKNPSYWGKDNLGPGKGNQLPYVDQLKGYNIRDMSTRTASLRTGKIDWDTELPWEDAMTLVKTRPDIKYSPSVWYSVPVVSARTDIPGKPFADVRVRRALQIATDMTSIQRDLYQGYAVINTFPASPVSKDVWVSAEQASEKVQELYRYSPERAKQLLAEAGYPNGFKTTMMTDSSSVYMDIAQTLASMWAKVGVQVEIQVKEGAVLSGIRRAVSYEDFVLGGVGLIFPFGWNQTNFTRDGSSNIPRVNLPAGSDPGIEVPYQEMQSYAFVDMDKAAEVYRTKLGPYMAEQAYFIGLPAPYMYTFWQPWVKNYAGELDQSPIYGTQWLRFAWVDQDLKAKFTGK
ncbi:MAG: ABC transporter substrate-binding protein [Chloroflexi bacterium]|nr:ABC transporter substrate-binding protein [Chloroflexota bacterium]